MHDPLGDWLFKESTVGCFFYFILWYIISAMVFYFPNQLTCCVANFKLLITLHCIHGVSRVENVTNSRCPVRKEIDRGARSLRGALDGVAAIACRMLLVLRVIDGGLMTIENE